MFINIDSHTLQLPKKHIPPISSSKRIWNVIKVQKDSFQINIDEDSVKTHSPIYRVIKTHSKVTWSDKEDAILKKWVLNHQSIINWKDAENLLPGRTIAQCKSRWRMTLKPMNSLLEMNNLDRLRILQFYEQVGNEWELYVKQFGRSANFYKKSISFILHNLGFEGSHQKKLNKNLRKAINILKERVANPLGYPYEDDKYNFENKEMPSPKRKIQKLMIEDQHFYTQTQMNDKIDFQKYGNEQNKKYDITWKLDSAIRELQFQISKISHIYSLLDTRDNSSYSLLPLEQESNQVQANEPKQSLMFLTKKDFSMLPISLTDSTPNSTDNEISEGANPLGSFEEWIDTNLP